MAEIYCDICYDLLQDGVGYKIIDRIMHDDFVRICDECEQEDELLRRVNNG